MPKVASRIVIFFLAHRGISQPEVWTAWRNASATPDKIVFRVYSEPDAPSNSIIAADRMDYSQPTSWGSSSVVEVIQKGYKRILAEFKDLRMIFLVSGMDIPLMPPDRLLALDASKSYVTFVAGDDSMYRVSPALLKDCNLRRHPNFIHLSWIHLTPRDAAVIAGFPISKLQCWFSHLRSVYARHKIGPPNPDEMFPWAMLRQGETDYYKSSVNRRQLTTAERHYFTDASPITWKSLDGEGQLIEIEDGVFERYTLRQVIEDSKEFAFLRKVAANVNLEGVFPWY